ncbi:MAG: 50S ribosomal protein L11 methyltransferase, partial [Methyloligellaceae bacterium]
HHSALQAQMPYDLLVANILAGPLIKMAPYLSQAVISNGYLILSGLLRTQSRSVIATYRNNHFTLESRIPLDEWMTLILKRT